MAGETATTCREMATDWKGGAMVGEGEMLELTWDGRSVGMRGGRAASDTYSDSWECTSARLQQLVRRWNSISFVTWQPAGQVIDCFSHESVYLSVCSLRSEYDGWIRRTIYSRSRRSETLQVQSVHWSMFTWMRWSRLQCGSTTAARWPIVDRTYIMKWSDAHRDNSLDIWPLCDLDFDPRPWKPSQFLFL